MTILACVEEPGYRLIVCGTPSAEWLEWVRTTTAPLTRDQLTWRMLAQARVDGRRASAVADSVGLAENLGLPVDPPPPGARGRGREAGRLPRTVRVCPHRDECDRCGHCEDCDCYCNT